MRYVSLLNHVYGAVAPRPLPLKLTSCYVPRRATCEYTRERALCVLMAMRVHGTRAPILISIKRDEVIPRRANLPAPRRPPFVARKAFVLATKI